MAIILGETGRNDVCLLLGKQGEHDVTFFEFDFSLWAAKYGDGVLSLRLTPNGSATAYPVTLDFDGTIATFTVTATDTATAGLGSAELVYIVGDDEKLKKSVSYVTSVEPSDDTGEAPEPYDEWLAHLEVLAGETSQAKTDAEQAASEAKASEQAAAASEQNAKTSENNAEEYADRIVNLTVSAHEATGETPTVIKTIVNDVYNLDFGLVPGKDGEDGKDGQDGADGVGIASVALNSDYTLTITLTDGRTYTTTSIRGEQGETGLTPDFTIGTVTTLAPGSQATATITGTDEEPVLNLGIPKGDPGDVSSTGYYPELYAGGLVTDKGETDTAPYVFRASKSLGYRESLNQIVGGTAGWNQLCNGSSVTVPNGHKYYMIKGGTASIGASTGTAITGLTSGTDIVTDLTAMFGTTIADYIYSLEQANAGAGVAWFRKLFPKPYYAYNAGELMSVQAVSHDMVGFNAWDEEWELGSIDNTTGQNVTNDSVIRSKNYIPVVPNMAYYFKSPNTIGLRLYDANKNYIDSTVQTNLVYTIPNDVRFIRFIVLNTTTYNNDICINLSKTTGTPKNGDYVAYESHTYPLDSDVVLRGIPKLDASNNLYYDGDTYASDGGVSRKFVEVTYDGSADEAWAKRTGDANMYFSSRVGANGDVVSGSIICDKYITANVFGNNTNLGINLTNSSGYNGSFVYVRPSDYETLSIDDFKARLATNPITVVYELATPTTENADPYTQIQICDPDGTEAFTDYGVESGDRDVAIPCGHETFYPEDLKGKLEDIPDIPEAPASNGTYTLKAVRSNSGVVYSWVSG